VVDPENAVLPGVTIIRHQHAYERGADDGAMAEGLYNLPALEPGEYARSKTELPGFAALHELACAGRQSDPTVDMKLGLAAVQETVTVSGAIH